jgi:gluconate 2-dehydrogenase gamma chain
VLSRAQAREIDAITSRIIPTDSTPGAHEAGVVYFIDKSLTTFAKGQAPMIMESLKTLGDDVAAKFPGQTRFSALTTAQQDEFLKSIEQTPFFGNMRFATIAGMLSLPTHGGNRNYVGWKLVGQDLMQDYKPPFGWYDQPKNKRALMGGGDE